MFRLSAWLILGVAIVTLSPRDRVSAALARAQAPALHLDSEPPMPLDGQRQLVEQYCAGCHNDLEMAGGMTLTGLDLARPEANAELAETVIRKLRSGMMPPAGLPRPSADDLQGLARSLEDAIDRAAARNPHVDAPELHRVNRKEYRNSIRDLLGVDVDVSELLPQDPKTGGFDNMADALTVSPDLMRAYVRAADRIARIAVGDREAEPMVKQYDVPKVVNQMGHVEGAPFGTRGGISVVHNFPADGTYTFEMKLWYVDTGALVGRELPEALQHQELEVSIDGERVAVFTVDPLMEELGNGIMVTDPIQITAGPHRVSAAFVAKSAGPLEDPYRLVEQTLVDLDYAIQLGTSLPPHLRTFTVTGPLKVTGLSETPSRSRIFTCYPTGSAGEEPCAREIIRDLAARAFRRPLDEAEVDDLLDMYALGRNRGDFETGIRTVVQAIIAMPEFIFRLERVPERVAEGEQFPIGDIELAARLSYFLWSSAPDDELLGLAEAGRLGDREVLREQVARMLADPRSETLATNFAPQWLHLTGIEEAHPEGSVFPNFTRNLALAMKREVELFFDAIVREDRSVLELLTADYTWVNEVLAEHYGIPNIVGNRFRRVVLEDPNRFGLLGKGAVLTTTSLSGRTSPVARGQYVLEVLVGSPPPLPPPVVPPLKENVKNERPLSLRERMEQHRESPACSACHQIMDPIGLALENFDAVGRWRTVDGGFQIDATSTMYDGTKLDGPASLRDALIDRSEAFIHSFARNLLAYGVGRVLDHRDMPVVRSISRIAREDGNRFSAFVMGVVESPTFRMRTESPAGATADAR